MEKIEQIEVKVKKSRVGPCKLTFKRYHDQAMNTYIFCDKDPARVLRVWAVNKKYWACEIQEKPSFKNPRGMISSYGGSILFSFYSDKEAWKFIVERAWEKK